MTVIFQEVEKQQVPAAIEVLARSLMVEPGFAHVIPDDAKRYSVMKALMSFIFGFSQRKGHVFVAVDNAKVVGAAVMLAPGNYPPSMLDQLRGVHHMIPLLRFGRALVKDLAAMDTNTHKYFPKTPCWYLEALGVDPSTQGKGVGSGLMRHIIAELGDETIYLETGTATNVTFYERLGFEVLNPSAQLAPNNGPTHWTMQRTGG